MAFLNESGLARFKGKIQDEIDQKKDLQSSVASPSAEGHTSAFIDTVSQNAQGVISATKKNVYGSDINISDSNNQKVGSAVEAIQNWKPSGNGTRGQVLRSKGDGTTEWAAGASQSEINTAVNAYMGSHMSPNQTIALDNSLTSTTSAAQAAAAGNQVLVTDSQPSASTNKLWIKQTPESEVSIPTMDEFDDLKSAFSVTQRNVLSMVFPEYPTLYDSRNTIDGFYYNLSNGKIEPSSNWFIQPPIPCKPSTQYTKHLPNITIFDADMNYIKTELWSDTDTFTTPANAAYFGISQTINQKNNVKIVEGNSAAGAQPKSLLDISQVKGLADIVAYSDKLVKVINNNTVATTYLPDLNTATESGYYIINLPYGSTAISHLPTNAFYDRIALFFNLRGNDTYHLTRQMYISEDSIYTRNISDGVASAWNKLNNEVDLSGVPQFKGQITSASQLTDFNNAANNSFYIVNLPAGDTGIANMPTAGFEGRLNCLLTLGSATGYKRQIYFTNKTLYSRGSSGSGSWDSWVDITNSSLADNALQYKGTLTSSNYSTVLPDLNNATVNGFYIMNFNYQATSLPLHFPVARWDGRLSLLVTYGNPTSAGFKRQFMYYYVHEYRQMTVYSRGSSGSGSWDDWVVVNPDPPVHKKIIVDKNGGGDYTSLTEAMRSNLIGCDFYVRPGEYDLFAEMKAKYGNDYFDNESFFDEGLVIDNDEQVWLDPRAIVKFNYLAPTDEGYNYEVAHTFSPFKFSGVGGELHGGQIICANCRYAIHDDCYATDHDRRITDGVYIYCRTLQNVGVGGGLGRSSYVEFKNCYVDNGPTGYGIWYHNATQENAQNFVSIHDNYTTATIAIQPYGPSTLHSKALVSNNRCKEVEKRVVQPLEQDNFDMIAWNNVTGS